MHGTETEAYELRVITMCQFRFIFGKKCTILVSALVMGEAVHIWE